MKIGTQKYLKFQITSEKKILPTCRKKKQIRKDQGSQQLQTLQQHHCQEKENGVISRNLKESDL